MEERAWKKELERKSLEERAWKKELGRKTKKTVTAPEVPVWPPTTVLLSGLISLTAQFGKGCGVLSLVWP